MPQPQSSPEQLRFAAAGSERDTNTKTNISNIPSFFANMLILLFLSQSGIS